MSKTKFYVFKESDGWHWSPGDVEFLDARGHAYKTRAAAVRAAKAFYARKLES